MIIIDFCSPLINIYTILHFNFATRWDNFKYLKCQKQKILVLIFFSLRQAKSGRKFGANRNNSPNPKISKSRNILSVHLDMNRNLHLLVFDNHGWMYRPSNKGKMCWSHLCYKPMKSDNMTVFIILTSKEFKKSVKGRQMRTKITPTSPLIIP